MKTILKRILLLCAVGLFLTSCCDCPSGDPENTITKSTADSLYNLYKANQYMFVNEAIASQFPENMTLDNEGVLFEDIDDLQKYLQLVKRKAADDGVQNPGIAVYFGARLDNTQTPKTTVFFEAVEKTTDPTPFDPSDLRPLHFYGSLYNKGRPFKPRPVDTTTTNN